MTAEPNEDDAKLRDSIYSLMRQHAQWWKTDKKTGMPPDEVNAEIMQIIKVRDAETREQGFVDGMLSARDNALYHLAYSGRKTIRGKDVDKLFGHSPEFTPPRGSN